MTRQVIALPILVIAVATSSLAQTSSSVRARWNTTLRVVPVREEQLRLVLVDLPENGDWIVGVKVEGDKQARFTVAEVRFDNVLPHPKIWMISNVLDWPAHRIQIRPGLIELSGLSEANGSVMIYLSVPARTEVTIDGNRGTIVTARPMTSLMVHNGLILAEEVHNGASLLNRLQFPRQSRSGEGPDVINANNGQYIATHKGLASHLLSFQKPEVQRSTSTAQALLRVTINESGEVTQVVPASGDEPLLSACQQVVRGWKFRPFVVNGTRVPVIGLILFVVHQDGRLWSPLFAQER